MKPAAPVPVAVLVAPVLRDPVEGMRALIAEANSGKRRCDPPHTGLLRVIPTTHRNAPRCPLRR